MCGNDKSFPCFKVGGNDAGTTRSFLPIFEGCFWQLCCTLFFQYQNSLFNIITPHEQKNFQYFGQIWLFPVLSPAHFDQNISFLKTIRNSKYSKFCADFKSHQKHGLKMQSKNVTFIKVFKRNTIPFSHGCMGK